MDLVLQLRELNALAAFGGALTLHELGSTVPRIKADLDILGEFLRIHVRTENALKTAPRQQP
jgi:hypothetical protein